MESNNKVQLTDSQIDNYLDSIDVKGIDKLLRIFKEKFGLTIKSKFDLEKAAIRDTSGDKYPMISKLVNENDFNLLIWKGRYSGVWACCMPESHGDIDYGIDIKDSSESGDNEAHFSHEFIFSVNWLPVESQGSINEAMSMLEYKIKKIYDSMIVEEVDWIRAVEGAMQHHINVTNKGNRMSFLKLPDDYLIVAKARHDTCGNGKEITWSEE